MSVRDIQGNSMWDIYRKRALLKAKIMKPPPTENELIETPKDESFEDFNNVNDEMMIVVYQLVSQFKHMGGISSGGAKKNRPLRRKTPKKNKNKNKNLSLLKSTQDSETESDTDPEPERDEEPGPYQHPYPESDDETDPRPDLNSESEYFPDSDDDTDLEPERDQEPIPAPKPVPKPVPKPNVINDNKEDIENYINKKFGSWQTINKRVQVVTEYQKKQTRTLDEWNDIVGVVNSMIGKESRAQVKIQLNALLDVVKSKVSLLNSEKEISTTVKTTSALLSDTSGSSISGLLNVIVNLSNKMIRVLKLKRPEWKMSISNDDLKEVRDKVIEYVTKFNEIDQKHKVMTPYSDALKLSSRRISELNNEFTTLVKTSNLNNSVYKSIATGGKRNINNNKKAMFIGESVKVNVMDFYR